MVLFLVFTVGVIFGSLGVVFLDGAQIKEISYFVDKILNETSAINSNNFLPIINSNLKLIGALWILGLTIIGIPLVGAVVFTRGFALGFTSAFIMKIKGLQGILTVFFALFPPNIFAIPLLLFAATNSIIFSLCLIKRSKKEISISKNFLAFTLSMLVIALVSAGVGSLQGVLSPLAIKAVFYISGR